jgi:hypothetical protein
VIRIWQKVEKEWRAGITGRLLLGFVMGVSVAGCSWSDRSGTHHLIVGIGFGVITTTNRPGVEVWDSRVLGGEIGPDGAGMGWLQHHQVAIDPALASNVVVSVKANPFSLTVKNFDPYSVNTNIQQNPIIERKTAK